MPHALTELASPKSVLRWFALLSELIVAHGRPLVQEGFNIRDVLWAALGQLGLYHFVRDVASQRLTLAVQIAWSGFVPFLVEVGSIVASVTLKLNLFPPRVLRQIWLRSYFLCSKWLLNASCLV